MRVPYSIALLLLVGFGCGRSISPSLTKEAPDAQDTVDSFAIYKVYTYDSLLASQKLSLAQVPWTDIYWPTEEAGLANRWTDDINPKAIDSKEEIGLGDFLKRYAGELSKPQPDPLLSPGEKYDMVYQYRQGITVAPDKLLAMSAAISKQDALIKAQTTIPAKQTMLKTMYDTIFTDDNSKLDQGMTMTMNGWVGFIEGSMNPKNRYLSNDKNPGEDWSWEGSCHGWSVAATETLPPKHSVMAVIGAQQVFFSEGDLRGLMTKAWADAAPDSEQYFLGRRCYSGKARQPIPSNANGRGYSGTLQLVQNGPVVPIIILDTLPNLLPVKLHGRERKLTAYQIRLETTGERKYLVEDYQSGGDPDGTPDEYWVADSFEDLVKAMKDDNPLKDLTQPFAAQLTGCWAVNPASFHETLVEQLGQRKMGFVMNRERVVEVWNQPIYSVDFQIGKLVELGSLADVAAKYRASGTAYLAQVHSTVSYTDEPYHPHLNYPAGFDLNSQTLQNYDYTLEFDAQRRVVGGEWGTFDKIDAGAPAPDFLMGFPQGTTPNDLLGQNNDLESANIDYSGIISKLHDCSMSDQIDGQLQVLDQSLAYSKCPIDKAN